MKCCIKCNIEKEDSEFSEGRNVCKLCRCEQRKLYRQNNPEKARESNKQSSKRYRQNNPEKVRERKKRYRQNNPEKVREKDKLYRQNNLEKVREKDKQSKKRYRQNNPEKARESNKQNSKRYRQNNPEKVREIKKRYRQNNPEKQMLMSARKRAKEKNLPFDIDESDIIIPTVCPILGIQLETGVGKKTIQPNSPSLDRIFPEKGYVRGNIKVISAKANIMKSSATPEELVKLGEYGRKLLEESNSND